MKGHVKLLAAVAVVMGGIAFLLVTGMSRATAYYLTVDELLARQGDVAGRAVRVMGKLVGDSIAYDPAVPLLRFAISGEGGQQVQVEYGGIQPDQMNDGWEAIVEGYPGEDGTLRASKVMIKCPSRYEAAPASAASTPSRGENR